jgi:hypothetical protein
MEDSLNASFTASIGDKGWPGMAAGCKLSDEMQLCAEA